MRTKNKGKICSTEGCELPARSRGMCNSCYQRNVVYPKAKAKRQASKQPGKAAGAALPSPNIDVLLAPVYANIKYLKTRRQQINSWLDALIKIAEFLEAARLM